MYYDIYNLNCYPFYKQIAESTRDGKSVAVFGVQSAEKSFVAANLTEFCLYVAGDYVEAQEITRRINAFTKKPFAFFPSRQEVLLYKKESAKSRLNRLDVLRAATMGEIGGIVTTPDALGQLLPFAQDFKSKIFSVSAGDVMDLTVFTDRLVDCGFIKVSQIEGVGQFTVRGDIVDVFLPQYDAPVRFDFFDDVVEDVKLVDAATLVSQKKLQKADIFCIKTIYNPSDAVAKAREESKRQKLNADATSRLDAILSALETDGDNEWLAPFSPSSLLCDFLPPTATILWDEPKVASDKLNRTYDGFLQRFANLLSKGEILPTHFDCMYDSANLLRKYQSFCGVALQTLPYGGTFFTPQSVINLKSSALFNYKFNLRQLADDVKKWQIGGYCVCVFAADQAQAQALNKQLEDSDLSLPIKKEPTYVCGAAFIAVGEAERGFISHSNKVVFVGLSDVYNKNPAKKLSVKREKVFLDLKAGDYAVHQVHGIGLCEGIVTRSGNFGTKDYIKLLYRDGDAVYVPVENTDMLSRYCGSDVTPRLSRLGGAEFEKVKAKVKTQIKAMAIDLVRLYASRQHKRGFRYKIDEYLNREFDAGFGYCETPDQLKCEEEIDADLTSDKIMDRLLVGDVGFGKTEVAMRTAFKVVANNKQAAFLAPTTILSEQHFNSLQKRCVPFNIKVECLNRFRNAAQQKKILTDLKSGKIDIIVGTHRLLGKDVKFKDLGFLILDEEQRFGVEDKEKIKVIKNNVDVLSMSATPIPRTLYMALSGMKDISVISTPPKERLPVETFVAQESPTLIRDAILREKDRQGQVFLVYNRVDGIEFFVEKIRALVPEVTVTYAHGQMEETLLESNVVGFAEGRYDVLISTTIIENGIDMPNSNTLIVVDSDKLGLSQLYQLRGRVGRSDKAAYAYFLYKGDKLLSDTALKRLSGIVEYTDLGSGFKIAMKDLEIRGAGNVLGREQHGHLVKVGYDMYVKLLNEAIDEIKGKKTDISFETEMEVAANAYVPSEYVPTKERMALYGRIAEVSCDKDADDLTAELTDVYGAPPQETLLLIKIALLKSLANKAGFDKVSVTADGAKLYFYNAEYMRRAQVFDAISAYKDLCKIDTSRKICLVFGFKGGDLEQNLASIKKFVSLLI